DARVSAQRDDPTAGPADVAEQQLDDRSCSDELRADAVLGPAHAVDQGRGAFPAGVRRPRLADLQELLGGDTAGLLDHLGGVAREMAFEGLTHAPRVLERR